VIEGAARLAMPPQKLEPALVDATSQDAPPLVALRGRAICPDVCASSFVHLRKFCKF